MGLADVTESGSQRPLAFIGAVDVDLADWSVAELPPITPPVSAITDDELDQLDDSVIACAERYGQPAVANGEYLELLPGS